MKFGLVFQGSKGKKSLYFQVFCEQVERQEAFNRSEHIFKGVLYM